MVDDLKSALSIFAEAVRGLLLDAELAYSDPAERAIVARLRERLHGKFSGWSIDLEWSRREDVIKRLGNDAIIPDMIVHRVGKRENLLAVEVKKSTNKDFDRDIWKLRGLTEQAGDYGYAAGLHLVLDVKSGKASRCDVYVDAQKDPGLTEWMSYELRGER